MQFNGVCDVLNLGLRENHNTSDMQLLWQSLTIIRCLMFQFININQDTVKAEFS